MASFCCAKCRRAVCVCGQFPSDWVTYIEDRITRIEEHEVATRTFLPEPPMPEPEKAKSDKANTGLVMVPFYSVLRIASIFVEGLRYGKDNWKKGVGDKEFQEERLEHALLHLIKWKEGDRSEDHLAKVAWFCVTQMELERLEDLQSLDMGHPDFFKSLENE